MPDVNSIPFRQADPNGHYKSKQLPNDQNDFLVMLGLPAYPGDVTGPAGATDGQMAVFETATGKQIRAYAGTGLIKVTTGVVGTTPAPNGAIVGTTDTQTLTNKTLTNPVITGLTGLTKADVGLANVDNTSDLAKPVSTAQQAALNLKEDKINKGIANGYASLDASTKIPMSQIPDALVGASQYQGTWNAATNTPAIPPASVGNKGWYYSVSVAGTTNINGINSWAVGDQIISNGTAWEKIPNVSAVNSVNGYTGAVVIAKADVGLSNVDNTSDATKNSAVATLTNKTLTAPVINNPTGIVKADVGLSNVDNTSDAEKNTAVATLTNKTLNSPIINTPTGITKADVGLGNVDNTSDATKNAAAATLTNKTINGANNTLTVRLDADVVNNLPVARLNSGTGANSGSFWRGDGQWAPPAGGGDVVGPTSSVDGELPLFSGTTGKVVKRCNLSGFVKAVANGAATAQTQVGSADIASGAVTNTHAAASLVHGQTAKTTLAPADEFLIWDSVSSQLRLIVASNFSRLPRNWLAGLVLANNATDAVNDIDVRVGECRDDTNSADIVIGTALTKQLDAAWLAGNNQGGRDTGVIADGTWHVFAIRNPTTNVGDVLLSQSISAPVMPSGFTQKRRIGSIIRNAGSIALFTQTGDYFMHADPPFVINAATSGPSATVVSSMSAGVPTGLKLECHVVTRFSHSTTSSYMRFEDPDQAQGDISIFNPGAGLQMSATRSLWCNANAQVRWSTGANAGTFTFYLSILGWWDTRGKDG